MIFTSGRASWRDPVSKRPCFHRERSRLPGYLVLKYLNDLELFHFAWWLGIVSAYNLLRSFQPIPFLHIITMSWQSCVLSISKQTKDPCNPTRRPGPWHLLWRCLLRSASRADERLEARSFGERPEGCSLPGIPVSLSIGQQKKN